MKIERFSAVPRFGIPADELHGITGKSYAEIMAMYDIPGEEVPTGRTDLKPINPQVFHMTRKSPEGPVQVSIGLHVDVRDAASMLAAANTRGLLIPSTELVDEVSPMVWGPSTRFAGQICLHELIAYMGE